jgi:hypothetical protein
MRPPQTLLQKLLDASLSAAQIPPASPSSAAAAAAATSQPEQDTRNASLNVQGREGDFRALCHNLRAIPGGHLY